MSDARLICLPPAGAGPSLFRPWIAADACVEAPGLPGREGRFREPPAPDLGALADRLAEDLAPRLPPRYALFGYSMGGALAALLAERLSRRGLPGPEALFVLGAHAPSRLGEGVARLHALSSEAFWAEVARLGGTPREILESPEMRELFEPALRADFRLCAEFRAPPAAPRLACPVHVFVGEDDPLVGPDCLADWQACAQGPVHLHPIGGGHMLPPPAFAALHGRIRSLWGQA